MAQEGRDIGGEKVFSLTQSDHKRTFLPDRNNFIRLLFIDDRKRICTLYFLDRFPDGHLKRDMGGMLPNQVAEHLGVGIRRKGKAFGLQRMFEFSVVFDYAVMNDNDTVRAVGMGVLI